MFTFDIIQFMMTEGVPRQTILMILMVPIVATIIAISRQVVGLKGFGIYTPLIITFAFYETGLKYGLTIFAAVLISGTLSRLIIKPFRFLYFPRMAMVTTIVALSTLVLLAEGAYSRRTGLISVSILPILIIITLVERFVATQIEKGPRTAVTLTIETLIVSIIGFYIISWRALHTALLEYPWIALLTLIVNIFLGKWTGLRILEYFRFREVIKNVELPKKK